MEYRDDIMPLAEAAGALDAAGDAMGPVPITPTAGVIYRLSLAIVDAADGNPLRVGVVFARLAGLSLREIGDRCRVSKQGIHKHIREVAQRNSALGELIRRRLAADEASVARARREASSVAKINQATRKARRSL
jgi:hypothetical protein